MLLVSTTLSLPVVPAMLTPPPAPAPALLYWIRFESTVTLPLPLGMPPTTAVCAPMKTPPPVGSVLWLKVWLRMILLFEIVFNPAERPRWLMPPPSDIEKLPQMVLPLTP